MSLPAPSPAGLRTFAQQSADPASHLNPPDARDRLPMGLQSSVPPHAVLLVCPDGELSGAVSSVLLVLTVDLRLGPKLSIPSSQPLHRRPTQPRTHHRMELMPSRQLRALTRPSL